MSAKIISQREARRARKELEQLRNQERARRNAWTMEWPRGVHLCDLVVSQEEWAQVSTARKLKHAVVITHVVGEGALHLRLYALPLSEKRLKDGEDK